MYNRLVELGVKLIFEINPARLESNGGRAGYANNIMAFYDEQCIHISYITEELIHAIQDHDTFGIEYMRTARKNVEFEAKVIQDMVSLKNKKVTGFGGKFWRIS